MEKLIEWAIEKERYKLEEETHLALLVMKMKFIILKNNEIGFSIFNVKKRNRYFKEIVECQKESNFDTLKDFIKNLENFMKNKDSKINGLSLDVRKLNEGELREYIIVEIQRYAKKK